KSEKVKNEKKQTNQGTLKKVQENSKKLRTKRYMVKTRPILNLNRGTGDLSSIFLFFCSATSFFFPNKILNELVSYEKMFYTFKAHSIIFPRRLDTTFKGCVNFLDDLVMISFRLKNLPIKIRQRALEIELQYMNQILPAKISLPFSDGMNIVNINIPFSRTLNSVENVPYILVYECSNKIKTVKKDFYNEIYLLRQLYALLKTGNENLTIIDKIIDQLVMDDSGSQNNSDDENLNTDILETGRSLSENSLNLDQNTHHTPSCTPSLQDGFVYKEEIVKKKNKQSWTETVQEIKEHSHFKDQKPEVKCIIIKTGNELGPEVIASEVISEMKAIFEEENLRIWIKPYRIYPVYHNAGFVEVVLNAKSIHEIKKAHNTIATGKTFLKRYYCEKYQDNIDKAKQNFLESLVGYSLVSYFLGLKDRHNGNILIDDEGHLVHVDFGFVLGLHPGIFCVETAPFKMSAEYIHLLGNRLDEFKKLFIQGFLAIRTNHKKLLRIMEICMGNPKYRFLDINSIDAFKKRLQPDLNNRELEDFIISLIDWSIKSTTTGLYDSYQYFSNGYMK
ncbi:Phosphatidylinositol 4-kinase, involved in intracellular trafficking and secretion, partial [Pseudoloma neurophilia]